MTQSSALIISDDTEFARALMARWQAERHVPAITLATSDLCNSASPTGYELIIVGPVRSRKPAPILRALEVSPAAVVYVSADGGALAALRTDFPRVLVIPRQDGWTEAVILVASEALRRVEALGRARRAEIAAASSERHATLGRYMLEMRHNVNNALTSVLGNADLLLLEPGQLSSETREQIKTIHTMALRLNEIMQRFSSLASEIQLAEKESQSETAAASHELVPPG